MVKSKYKSIQKEEINMPRMPLSETSAKWMLPVAVIIFALIGLFNAYKLGRLRIQLTYKTQLIVSVVIILLANILTTVLKHWVYRSIGFVLCGLLWIINPAMINIDAPPKKHVILVRLSGVVLILIGIFTRAYYY